jgi:hypothetical protein
MDYPTDEAARPCPTKELRMMDNSYAIPSERFARCISGSKRVRWEIETDVIRGRRFDRANKFLPDGLTLVRWLDFLSPLERIYFSQVQGRTYANMFGLVERFIGAKVLELSRDHWLGDQVALEALVRFGDEELKHQALFRRVEALAGQVMPTGYRFAWDPNEVAATVLSKSSWAVLALTLHIELFTQSHYRESIKDADLSELYKDIFLFHWKEECQHAIMDELEWRRLDAGISSTDRDMAVNELIQLVEAVDRIVQAQAAADSAYFVRTCGRELSALQTGMVHKTLLEAYRFQYILSGARHPHFASTLISLTTDAQLERIHDALSSLAPMRALVAV